MVHAESYFAAEHWAGGSGSGLVRRTFCEPSHSFGPARREYYLLHFVAEGCGVYHCGGEDYPVGPGQMFVIRPEEMTVYRADAQNPWHYIWVGFRVGEPLEQEVRTLLQQNVFTIPNARRIFFEIAASGQLHASRELFVCGKVYADCFP